MTVLQVIPAMKSGGAELGALQVGRALVEAGHRAFIMSEGGRMVADIRKAGVVHVEARVATKNPVTILLNGFRIARFCRENDVGVIHARSRAPAWSCYVAVRLTGAPFVTTYHSGYSEQNYLKHLYNRVMALSDRVIAVSDWIADLIASRYRPDPDRVVVIHRAVCPAVFDPAAVSEARRAALRRKWGAPDDARIVLLAGRIARRKGQDTLVGAAAILKADPAMPPFICILAGDDQGKARFRDDISAGIRAAGVEDVVKMVGHVDDMPAAYAAADVSVSAALAPEGYQRAMLESQAMGCPVVVSDVGPGVEVVHAPPRYPEPEMTGLNFKGGDARALAGAIKHILTLPEAERRAIGARGSAWVRTEHTVARLTGDTIALYRELVG